MNDPVVPLWSATVNYTLNSTTFLEGDVRARLASPGGLRPERRRRRTSAPPVPGEPGRQPGDQRARRPAVPLPRRQRHRSELLQLRGAERRSSPPTLRRHARAAAAGVPVGQPRSPTRRRTTPIPGFADYSAVKDVAVSLTKVWGRHTLKTGYYNQYSAKQQNQGNAVRHAQLRQRRATTRSTRRSGSPTRRSASSARTRRRRRFVEGAVHLQQRRGLHPGQLEGEQQADARLRRAVRAPAAAVRDAPARRRTSCPTSGRAARRRCSTSPAAPTASIRAPAPTARR